MTTTEIFATARRLRRRTAHQDFQRTMHYNRTCLDRNTAAVFLSCWPKGTMLGDYNVSGVMYLWEVEASNWNNMRCDDTIPFTVREFVQCMICLQDLYDSARIKGMEEHQPDKALSSIMREEFDAIMAGVEYDLYLAGFLERLPKNNLPTR